MQFKIEPVGGHRLGGDSCPPPTSKIKIQSQMKMSESPELHVLGRTLALDFQICSRCSGATFPFTPKSRCFTSVRTTKNSFNSGNDPKELPSPSNLHKTMENSGVHERKQKRTILDKWTGSLKIKSTHSPRISCLGSS